MRDCELSEDVITVCAPGFAAKHSCQPSVRTEAPLRPVHRNPAQRTLDAGL